MTPVRGGAPAAPVPASSHSHSHTDSSTAAPSPPAHGHRRSCLRGSVTAHSGVTKRHKMSLRPTSPYPSPSPPPALSAPVQCPLEPVQTARCVTDCSYRWLLGSTGRTCPAPCAVRGNYTHAGRPCMSRPAADTADTCHVTSHEVCTCTCRFCARRPEGRWDTISGERGTPRLSSTVGGSGAQGRAERRVWQRAQ